MADGRKSGAHNRQELLEHLLNESQRLRERSDQLAREVERLREQVARLDGPRAERRKKPRIKGK
jgi:predicted  nucleic acid-binding Zn-ribbon protein